MEQNKEKDIKTFINTSVDIICGSAVKTLYPVYLNQCLRTGINRESLIKPIIFDFDNKIPPSLLGLTNDVITTDMFVPAVLPSKTDSLEKAENQKLLVRMPKNWHSNPGLSTDNKGASGNPCIGYTYAKLNANELTTILQKRFQKAKDYNRRYEPVLKGTNIDSIKSRVTVNVYISVVGGMGSGSVFPIINDIIRKCVRQDSIEVKVVLHLMLRGNLFIHDIEQANINTYTTAKYLQALATAALIDAETGQLMQVPFDMVYAYSNLNSSGNIKSFEAFLYHQGHTKFFYSNSPGGQSLQARENDIGNICYDEYGSPQAVYTMSTASLGRDSNRETMFLTNLTAAAFADSLLAKGDLEKVISYSAELARHIHMVESDEENQVTSLLSRPKQLAGENVYERANSSLTDRIENTSGSQKADTILDSVNIIIADDMQTIHRPAIIEQARENCTLTINRIESVVQRLMRDESGLWDSGKLVGSLKITSEGSYNSLSEKTAELTGQIAAQQAIIAEAEEQLEHIRQQSWLIRTVSFFYNFFVIRRICSILQQSGRALIRFTLELELCNIAIEHFLEPLSDYLDNKISWISSTGPKLVQLSKQFKNQASDIASSDTILQTPVGFQFTKAEYLAGSFSSFVELNGGVKNFPSYIIGIFLQKHGSLETVIEASATEISDALTNLYRGIIEPIVKSTSISNIIRHLPEAKQKALFTNIVTESEGRLQVDGNQPWIKAANVPSEKDAIWVRDMLDSVDFKGGNWEIAVNNDIDNITIAQLTGGFGFDVILNDLDIPDTPSIRKKIIEKAVEPATAFFVDPNPDIKDFKLVLTKAIASELLTVDNDDNFSIKWFSDEQEKLGSNFEAVHQRLQPKFRQLKFIESTFTRDLVVDEEKIFSTLKQILSHLQTGQADTDKRLGLIDADSVTQCLVQSEMLMPRLRRLRDSKRIN